MQEVYSPLPAEITTSAPTYPAYPASLDDVNARSDHAASRYGASAPGEHQALTLREELLRHARLRSSIGPQILSDTSPVDENDDFASSTPPRASSTPYPPAPPLIPNAAPPGDFDMLPPPASSHSSWQALHEYAQSHASEHGYALSINTTAKNRSRIKLACVCYGAPKNTHKLTPETRVRKNRVSYKTGCKMWIEAKKQEDGLWTLRVGEGLHNHPGRASEGWAVQRKRTWRVQGGRIGVGGVTAKEEQERMYSADNGQQLASSQADATAQQAKQEPPSHSLESGGIVWRIIEQEMLRKRTPGQGRDRGVGRTVKILEQRLPGIHIFKRDVYNIRAQIRRARKAAGQQVGEGLDDSEDEFLENEGLRNSSVSSEPAGQNGGDERGYAQIDPSLIAQCNSALRSMPQHDASELERLRRENAELRQALAQRTKEMEEKNGENESLRMQVELANMALYERGSASLVDRMQG